MTGSTDLYQSEQSGLVPPAEGQQGGRPVSEQQEPLVSNTPQSPLRPDENAYERARRHRIERNRVKLYSLGIVDTLLSLCGVGPPKPKRKPREPKPLVATRRSARASLLPRPDYMDTPAPTVTLYPYGMLVSSSAGQRSTLNGCHRC